LDQTIKLHLEEWKMKSGTSGSYRKTLGLTKYRIQKMEFKAPVEDLVSLIVPMLIKYNVVKSYPNLLSWAASRR
jgi:hypothetical protein